MKSSFHSNVKTKQTKQQQNKLKTDDEGGKINIKLALLFPVDVLNFVLPKTQIA